MKRNVQWIVSGFIILIAATVCPAAGPYHFIKEIPIGDEGGWDLMTVDSTAQRLYVSHMTQIVVIDLAKDQIIGEITNTPGVHGIAIASDLGLGITSNGREDKASVVNLNTLQTLSKVDAGEGPDSMLYNPAEKAAWLFDERGQTATVIDAKSAKVVATIPLGGRPEFAVCDPKANQVYDNLEDKNEVAVIDAGTRQVVHRWPIAPGASASGLAIDVVHHRLFIGCHNEKMVMMDDTTGKVPASVPIGQGVDACAFDPGTQLAFASCGDGTTTIAKEAAADKLTVVQVLKTERGARTMALDPATHKIYLATAQFEPQPQPAAGERWQRPKIIPGTFKILVYGIEESPGK